MGTGSERGRRRDKAVVAIDGPAGAGKSTIARLLAARLGLPYLDTGAMYRAAALLALRHGFGPPYGAGAGQRVADLVGRHRVELVPTDRGTRVLLDDEDVSVAIRTPEMSVLASAVSALSEVRRVLVALQRSLGEARGGVMEGRDIGTVVFPDADLKVFLTASPEERARRRWVELERRGRASSLEEVRAEQEARDARDSTRDDSPLQVADGAVVVDTTGLAPDEVVERLAGLLGQAQPSLVRG